MSEKTKSSKKIHRHFFESLIYLKTQLIHKVIKNVYNNPSI